VGGDDKLEDWYEIDFAKRFVSEALPVDSGYRSRSSDSWLNRPGAAVAVQEALPN
jgi:hypothetical protein